MKKVHFYPTENRGLQLKWGDGWIEVFPENEFEEECNNYPRKIRMYHKRQKGSYEICLEEYYLTVKDNIAVLNYGDKFEKANLDPSRDIYIGELKIIFCDITRTIVKKVLWRDKGKRKFEEYDTDFSWQKESIPTNGQPFKLPSKQKKIRYNSLSVLRTGQLRFRMTLLKVYNEKCCITGFDVKEALEAAHIVPFNGEKSDHIQNGILIRADLHRLFDKLLISIDPNTFEVKLAPSLQKNSLYSDLHNVKLRLPSNKNHWPAPVALEHHYNKFRKK